MDSLNKINWPLIIILPTFGLWVYWVIGGIVRGPMFLDTVDLDLVWMLPLSSLLVALGVLLALPLLVFVLVIRRRLSPIERMLGIAPAAITLLFYTTFAVISFF